MNDFNENPNNDPTGNNQFPQKRNRGLAPINRNDRTSRKPNGPPKIIVVLISILLLSCVCYGISVYMPNFKTMDYYEHHAELDNGEIQMVLKDEFVTEINYPVIESGEIYIPVDFIKKYVDPYIYWDEKAQKLTLTTEYRVIRMNTDELTYYVNSAPMNLNLAVFDIGGIAYIPKAFLEEQYDIKFEYNEEYGIIYADNTAESRSYAEIISKTEYFRFEPHKKSYAIQKLLKGAEVVVYEQIDDYTKIRYNGVVGYVTTKSLGEITSVNGVETQEQPLPRKDLKPINGKINMLWDMILQPSDNTKDSSKITHAGLDVISPTWFSFERENYSGEIISLADLRYVDWAHKNGYQVWPLISDSEDGEITAQILSDQKKREEVIKQILAYVSIYDLDGINIDFERVRQVDVEYFHQFLRELSPLLKEQGVYLSVDTFVPSAWSMYYNRGEIAKSADYICVMSYDENTYGNESGPNASIGFVRNSVLNTLAEVPSEQILMGIPFYTRVWIETQTPTGTEYKIRSLGMNYAYSMFTSSGGQFEWIEDLGCFYGEFDTVEDGVEKKYRTWLEDENSMALKLDLINEYDLGGACAWVRGLEKTEIWDLIYEKLK